MGEACDRFRQAADELAGRWLCSGLPSRQGMMAAAAALEQMRNDLKVESLWDRAPRLLTATLDDGIGQGLAVIEAFAAAIGMDVIPIGLMQTADIVIGACRQHGPHFLGLTVLQFDTEDDLIKISRALPADTRIVAGGPVFSADPGFADRTGIHYAARHVADFLRFMVATTTAQPLVNR
jgi:methylmalonyl-CoA mutase cobalamin-binding subunit